MAVLLSAPIGGRCRLACPPEASSSRASRQTVARCSRPVTHSSESLGCQDWPERPAIRACAGHFGAHLEEHSRSAVRESAAPSSPDRLRGRRLVGGLRWMSGRARTRRHSDRDRHFAAFSPRAAGSRPASRAPRSRLVASRSRLVASRSRGPHLRLASSRVPSHPRSTARDLPSMIKCTILSTRDAPWPLCLHEILHLLPHLITRAPVRPRLIRRAGQSRRRSTSAARTRLCLSRPRFPILDGRSHTTTTIARRSRRQDRVEPDSSRNHRGASHNR